MNRTAILIVVFAFLFLGILIWSSLGLKGHRVEVCITFQGGTACRTASASTREQALRAATDNACAFLASGMTDAMACGRTKPDSVKWLEQGARIGNENR